MSKTITLTIGERLAALGLFDAFKGSISELAVVTDDIKKVAIPIKDWEAAGREVTKGRTEDGKETESWKWNEADEKTYKEIELGAESVAYLVKSIKTKSDAGDISLKDGALISLNAKLI